jgi:hypothetical protein
MLGRCICIYYGYRKLHPHRGLGHLNHRFFHILPARIAELVAQLRSACSQYGCAIASCRLPAAVKLNRRSRRSFPRLARTQPCFRNSPRFASESYYPWQSRRSAAFD